MQKHIFTHYCCLKYIRFNYEKMSSLCVLNYSANNYKKITSIPKFLSIDINASCWEYNGKIYFALEKATPDDLPVYSCFNIGEDLVLLFLNYEHLDYSAATPAITIPKFEFKNNNTKSSPILKQEYTGRS